VLLLSGVDSTYGEWVALYVNKAYPQYTGIALSSVFDWSHSLYWIVSAVELRGNAYLSSAPSLPSTLPSSQPLHSHIVFFVLLW
jgi:hypothetical protein